MSTEQSSCAVEIAGKPNGAPIISLEYERERFEAIRESAAVLIQDMFADHRCDCVWNLLECIWPARALRCYREHRAKDVSLVLLPLNRIGQMEGKSGSLVLIGYFKDKHHDEVPLSHPVVVKTMPADRRKLRAEYDNACSIRPFVYEHKDVFAIPVRFDQHHSFDVLWSLFSAADPLWRADPNSVNGEPSLKARDLRSLIATGTVQEVDKVVTDTFSILRNLHVPFGKRASRRISFGEEYSWYLRGYGVEWGTEWREVFGTPERRLLEDGCVNPLWLVERLKQMSADVSIGAVHGDLHPGNIVLTNENHPRVIDFGWSRDDAHIAKDFALMECNLRFLTLRPQLPRHDVEQFAAWCGFGTAAPERLTPYTADRTRLMIRLRDLAKDVFPAEANWNFEYLVPVFLVAFGLLRFAPHLGNQQAAISTVLELARYLHSNVPELESET